MIIIFENIALEQLPSLEQRSELSQMRPLKKVFYSVAHPKAPCGKLSIYKKNLKLFPMILKTFARFYKGLILDFCVGYFYFR